MKDRKKKPIAQHLMLFLVFVILPFGSFLYLKYGLSYYIDRLDELGDLGQAPEFRLTNQEGDTISLKDLKGKMSVIGYFSSDCGVPCDSFSQAFSRIQAAFPDNYRINLLTYFSDSSNVQLVDNKKMGSKWYWLQGEKVELDTMFSSAYNMNLADGYSNQFALVDSSYTIRRLYDAMDINEINRLVVHLAMAAPRPPKQDVKFEREKEK